MASRTSRQSKEMMITHLSKVTKLSRDQVANLMKRFEKLCTKEDGRLHRMEFREELNTFFNISDDIIMDRVFRAFDEKSCGTLKVEDYVIGIGRFLNGTTDDHVQLCFDVYDVNNDGYISREDMYQLLKNSLIKAPTEEDPDEVVKELIEVIIKILDIDHDGRVSITDFKGAVAEDKLLLECLGKCLPDKKSCMSFIEMVSLFGGGECGPSMNSMNISQQKELQRQKGMRSQKAIL